MCSMLMNKCYIVILLLLIILPSCTKNETVNLVITKDTTIVLKENPTGVESWLRLTVTNALQHDILIETSHEIIQKTQSKSLYSNLYKVIHSKPNQVIVQDYGQKVNVSLRGIKEKVLLKIEAPTNNNEGGMSTVKSRIINQ